MKNARLEDLVHGCEIAYTRIVKTVRGLDVKMVTGTVEGAPYCNQHKSHRERCTHKPNTVLLRVGARDYEVPLINIQLLDE